jgi:hypothetical protein
MTTWMICMTGRLQNVFVDWMADLFSRNAHKHIEFLDTP